MHRDILSHIQVTCTDFIITASIDGFVKFWKKTEKGIEFVKTYRAHLSAMNSVASSGDGLLFCTSCAADKTIKVFDVLNFDMINIIKVDFVPSICCWVYQRGDSRALLAVSNANNGNVVLLDAKSGDNEIIHTVSIHSSIVKQMKFNENDESVVSIDEKGIIEYWSIKPPFSLPSNIDFRVKSDTSLFELAKCKTTAQCLSFSSDFSHFVINGTDRIIRIFKYSSGKLVKSFNESCAVLLEMQKAGTLAADFDEIEFGKRFATEQEIDKSASFNVIFDESGNFILFASMIGIKVINWRTNSLVRVIGKSEEEARFLNICLYQGTPKKKGVVTFEMAASDNPAFQGIEFVDPTLFCTAFKKSRFYMFTKQEPTSLSDRDILNEKPVKEDATNSYKGPKFSSATIHTDFGDVVVKLFPDAAPKAVENFITLAKKGYYNGVIFHRVIRGFMIQTGDPNGDGTGGTSMWNKEFEDEFSKEYKHDRPYTLSMANAGPNTNGSQFFITTVETPWLDNKHTVFGRATSGFDVIHKIERAETDNNDKPKLAIHIYNIDIK